MPGTIPGPLGLFAFVGIKFVGYSLAASALKHFEPTIVASATKIAGVGTGLGFLLGPPATFIGLFLSSAVIFRSGYSPFRNTVTYGILFIARISIWALLLFLFTKKAPLPKSSLWLYALLGAIVSSLLDWPGYALASHAPGQLVFC
ncbi:MAG TPA: hypothetical protein VE263_06495 [Candidatus Angelobacter sp.]|nr:hypothetical protein [Candidatus Angelobacter sp.]